MVALTLLDVWVVYFLHLKSGLLVNLPLSWWFPFWIMEFTFPLSLILMFENKIPLTCYLFFVMGGEDTLFHLFSAGHIPEIYRGIYFLGLVFSPAREFVLKAMFLSFLLSFLICYMEYEKLKQRLIKSRYLPISV